jgi:hypothetical protein
MFRFGFFVAFLFVGLSNSHAQWEIEESHTAADLRGIDALANGIAWASGSQGTVLRTTDDGAHWQRCATPPGAEALDFRGIQAFDASTAIVMSSGKGPLSRLYKTTDAGKTWDLIAKNPDKDGLWDAVQREGAFWGGDDPDSDARAVVLGDSVGGRQRVWEWKEGWGERELEPVYMTEFKAEVQEASFAASNSVLQIVKTPQVDKTWKYRFRWVSGTTQDAYMWIVRAERTDTCEPCSMETKRVEMPLANNSPSAGTFSFGFSTDLVGVAVGGDYTKPDISTRTAAYTSDAGYVWKLPDTPPHGFRSAVAYSPTTKTWITVGPNGTDISTDDGRNWHPLKPTPNDPPDADQHWNALSLPFVVGPHGRIGKLNTKALGR